MQKQPRANSGTHPDRISQAAALAGRRIDSPDADQHQFPLAAVPAVRSALSSLFQRERIEVLACSAACGADLLALDVALTAGIRCRVVLPYAVERFRETSVVDRPGNWGALFDKLIQSVATQGDLLVLKGATDDSHSYEDVNRILIQEATAPFGPNRALAIVVWEGRSRGTGDFTAHFRHLANRAGMAEQTVSTVCR